MVILLLKHERFCKARDQKIHGQPRLAWHEDVLGKLMLSDFVIEKMQDIFEMSITPVKPTEIKVKFSDIKGVRKLFFLRKIIDFQTVVHQLKLNNYHTDSRTEKTSFFAVLRNQRRTTKFGINFTTRTKVYRYGCKTPQWYSYGWSTRSGENNAC